MEMGHTLYTFYLFIFNIWRYINIIKNRDTKGSHSLILFSPLLYTIQPNMLWDFSLWYDDLFKKKIIISCAYMGLYYDCLFYFKLAQCWIRRFLHIISWHPHYYTSCSFNIHIQISKGIIYCIKVSHSVNHPMKVRDYHILSII